MAGAWALGLAGLGQEPVGFGMRAIVAIKGAKTGLVVSLAEEPALEAVRGELTERLRQGAAFFRDARITLSVGARVLSVGEWQDLRDLLVAHGVALHNVVATSDQSRQAARAAGIALAAPVSAGPAPRQSQTASAPVEDHNGMLIKRNLRSGQSVRHPGHVVVLGDLHAGAEIISGGDIIVWGALRGIAHAGALGDAGSGIYALQLAPTQLRIAQYVARPPESAGDETWPEAARVHDGQIVVESWSRSK
jgi:septum site-determining protein MinC